MTSSVEDFDVNYDKKDHKGHDSDELCYEPSFFPCFNDSLASPLCVPQDPLEELEWYPSFCNDPLDLDSSFQSDYNFFDTFKNEKFETKPKCDDDHVSPAKVQNKSGFVKKKPRTMKPRRKRAFGEAWSKSAVGFFENSKPNRGKKCSHCETIDTPLWRAGPLGRNTLCNACGVRYKSGRLLPEYRPASSPTFDGKRHSNFHKKILKNRGHNNII